jgi:6-phosphogluconate dehydrogenase (decarboxylating)
MTSDRPMELEVVGLGRMGTYITRRLMRDGHTCVVSDLDPTAMDCGTSDGLYGLDGGFCLMEGGDVDVFEHLEPIFASLAPGWRRGSVVSSWLLDLGAAALLEDAGLESADEHD